jgi:hypothetical protein
MSENILLDLFRKRHGRAYFCFVYLAVKGLMHVVQISFQYHDNAGDCAMRILNLLSLETSLSSEVGVLVRK